MPVTWQRKTFSQSNGGSDELLVCPTCGSTCTRDSAIIHAAWHLPKPTLLQQCELLMEIKEKGYHQR